MEEEVKLAKKGDKVAYQNLINSISIYLYNIAISFLRNDTEAADAIGNTVLKAYLNIGKLKENKYFKTWITKILINECKQAQRKNKKIVFVDEYSKNIESREEKIAQEDKIDLINAINNLDKKTKDVIILHYYNDFKIEEIATILNIPIGTVKSRMNTGKKKLYELLKEGSES